MPAVEIVDDGAAHAHDHAAEPGVGAIAANVVVSAWTWRYDDPADRLRSQLQHLASDALIEQLAPRPDVVSARATAGEVSWVIVRTISVDGPVATVEFDHHLVTSTSAETITTRTAVVTVLGNRAIEVNA